MNVRGTYRLRQQVRRFRRRFGRRAVVLVYHRVARLSADPWGICVSPHHFREQLAVLRRHFRPMALSDLRRSLQHRRVAPRSVALTFDDGYADSLHAVQPALRDHDIPATFFITTGYVGGDREFWWDELERVLLQPGTLPACLRLTVRGDTTEWTLDGADCYREEDSVRHQTWRAWQPPPTARHALYAALWHLLQRLSDEERQQAMETILSWAGLQPMLRPSHRCLTLHELRALAEDSRCQVGAHTESHRVLAALTLSQQRDEVRRSKDLLEKTLGQPISAFAYPYGKPSDYTQETITLVREAGFQMACTNSAGLVTHRTDAWQVPRLYVHDWPGEEFHRRIAEAFEAAS